MKSKLMSLGLAGLLGLGMATTAQAAEKWSMATPWGGGFMLEFTANGVADNIMLLTNNEIEVEVFPGGTLGKALKVTDTVRKGVAQIGHNWSGYDWGIDKTAILFGSFAGTMEHDKMMHWLYRGGGAEMWMDWRLSKFGVAAFPCGSAPREIFLHSHRRVQNLADYKGMKVRTAGAWAEIAQDLGVSTVILAGAEVYPALERKVVDGIEWGTPHINVIAGFDKVAKYIIVPGVHQPNAFHECPVNLKAWEGLDDRMREVLKVAGKMMVVDLYLKLGHDDAPAWQKYVNSSHVEIVDLDDEFKAAAKAATDKWAAKQGEDNEWFAKVWGSQQAYKEVWSEAHRYR